MNEPPSPLEGFLKSFSERLERSTTHDEWREAIRQSFISSVSGFLGGREPSEQEGILVERVNSLLKNGFVRSPGRPNNDKSAKFHAKLFHLLRPNTISDGARLLRATETWVLLFGKQQPGAVPPVTDDAMRKRAKLAAQEGYVFPEKGMPFRRQRKKLD